jgi:hypothetical protein
MDIRLSDQFTVLFLRVGIGIGRVLIFRANFRRPAKISADILIPIPMGSGMNSTFDISI